jgi:hypothetical protein
MIASSVWPPIRTAVLVKQPSTRLPPIQSDHQVAIQRGGLRTATGNRR